VPGQGQGPAEAGKTELRVKAKLAPKGTEFALLIPLKSQFPAAKRPASPENTMTGAAAALSEFAAWG
jgi:hypothetical protein